MRIRVYLTAAEAEEAEFQDRTAVVVDVLRATSSIVRALASGASAIYPTSGTEDAIKLATSLGRDDTLLCGERRGLKIEGYDLGNSPGEFTPETVEGKRLIMNTTNGTRALLATEGAERVVVASFLNLRAVAETVRGASELAVVCAGRDDAFALEDAACAGLLLRRIALWREDEPPAARTHAGGGGVEPIAPGTPPPDGWKRAMNDAAVAAWALAARPPIDASFLHGTDAGGALVELGLGADLELCAQLDRFPVVPTMRDRQIVLPRDDAPRSS